MGDTLKQRVQAKLRRQIAGDGGTAAEEAEGDDPRLVAMDDDLAALGDVEDNDPLVDKLATKYWVP